MKGLENGDGMTFLDQVAGHGQTGWARTDHGDPFTGRRGLGRQLPGAVLALPVGHETFQVADGHRFAALADDALALALDLLGTHPTTDGRQGILGPDVPNGAGKVALCDQVDKTRNVHAHRAPLQAAGFLALQAARRLLLGHGDRVAGGYLFEIALSDFRGLFGHGHPRGLALFFPLLRHLMSSIQKHLK